MNTKSLPADRHGFAPIIILIVIAIAVALGAGYVLLQKGTSEKLNTETSVESEVQTAVDKVLTQSELKDAKLISVQVVGGKVTLDFTKEILSKGPASFEEVFRSLSNIIYPIIQGEGRDPNYPELQVEVFIEGKPLNEVPDVTSTWKTYTNTQYGFEFKYPDTWNIKETDKNSWQLIHNNNLSTNFIFYENRSTESLLECAVPDRPATDCKRDSFIASGVTYQTLSYNSFSERGNFLGYSIVVVGEHNKKTIFASINFGKDKSTQERILQELNVIFSTFKFTQ